jgi:hypothetical protein
MMNVLYQSAVGGLLCLVLLYSKINDSTEFSEFSDAANQHQAFFFKLVGQWSAGRLRNKVVLLSQLLRQNI